MKTAILYRTTIKLKAKEVFQAVCSGRRYTDINYDDEIISKIYDVDENDVWHDIDAKAEFYHKLLAEKNLKEIQ